MIALRDLMGSSDPVIRHGAFAALRTGIEAGIITRNEARSYMDFEEVEGGDDFLQALNMGTGGGATNLGDDTSGGVAEGDIGGINET